MLKEQMLKIMFKYRVKIYTFNYLEQLNSIEMLPSYFVVVNQKNMQANVNRQFVNKRYVDLHLRIYDKICSYRNEKK